MISANDLLLWANGGVLPPEEPIPEPPPPNFRGDILKFTRRDKDGVVRQAGYMHRDHILTAQEAGEDITIEDDDHPGLPAESPATFTPVDPLTALRTAIARALDGSDHYFLADRADVGDDKRTAWAEYRRALRAAAKETSLAAALSRIPLGNPQGNDPFSGFRGSSETEQGGSSR